MNIPAQSQPSFKKAIRFGWETIKTNILFFIGFPFVIIASGYILFMLALVFTLNMVGGYINIYFVGMAYQLASSLTYFIVSFTLAWGALKCIDNKSPTFMHFISGNSGLLIKYILASFLSTVIIGIGFILLIIPGIIWSIKYQFVGYTVIDKNLNPFEALKSSADLTKGIFWKLAGFISLMFLINIGGFLFWGIGLLVTIPITTIAHVYLYRSLVSQSEVVVIT